LISELLFRSQTIPAGSKGADQRFVAGDKRDSYSTAALLEKMVKFFYRLKENAPFS